MEIGHGATQFFCHRNTGSGYTNDNKLQDQILALGPYDTTGFLMSGYLADLNGDGWPDLVVQPCSGAIFDYSEHTTHIHFHNGLSGDSASFNAGTSSGLDNLPAGGMAFGDIDNDGDLDAFGMGSAAIGGPTVFQTRIFQNNGQGVFTDITTGSGLPTAPTSVDPYYVIYNGSAIADFDNDGLQDIIWAAPGSIQLYRNMDKGQFQKVNLSLNASGGNRPMRMYVADYNNDGKLDFVVGSGGTPNSAYLFKNTTENANHWLKVRLKGTTLKTAIGSQIYVYAAGHLNDPAYLLGYRQVIMSHSHRQPLEQHFGLGGATACDLKVVFFSDKGVVVEKRGLAVDRMVVLNQDGTVSDKH
jgi:hypothetical protein